MYIYKSIISNIMDNYLDTTPDYAYSTYTAEASYINAYVGSEVYYNIKK